MRAVILSVSCAVLLAIPPAFAAGPDAPKNVESAADDEAKQAELAMKLQNPVADLISVPIQNNWDFRIGPAKAMRFTANVQPVIPFSLTKDWLVITRSPDPRDSGLKERKETEP